MLDVNDFKIENMLGFSINRASIILRKRLTTMLKDAGYDITPEEFALLSRLWEEDGISQSTLIEKTLKDKTRVTRLLNGLTKKSYVYKKTKEDDKRNQIVYLTDEGLSIKFAIIPIVQELMMLTTEGISTDELKITKSVLSKIFSNLNDS